jgi:hypothetical protein
LGASVGFAPMLARVVAVGVSAAPLRWSAAAFFALASGPGGRSCVTLTIYAPTTALMAE